MKSVATSRDYEIWLNEDRNKGYFESKWVGDDDGGGLWFEARKLIDYDGRFSLPEQVINELLTLGFIVGDEFYPQLD